MSFPLMRNRATRIQMLVLSTLALILSMPVFAHCDTLDGPVVTDAKSALAENSVEPVLKWVRPRDEAEIRALFAKTVAVREGDDAVRELVDRHFFETLVRVHRAGEGAPYTGLKPADTPVEPGIEEAEEALATKSDDLLVTNLQTELGRALNTRYLHVIEAKDQADESVEAGRAYVAAYVEYIHFVERIHEAITSASHEVHGKSHEAPSSSQIEDHGSDAKYAE